MKARPETERIVLSSEPEKPAAPAETEKSAEDAKLILISRVTCPNCKAVEGLLAKAGIAYEKKIAEENLDLCKAYGVKGAPTLIVLSGDSFTTYYGIPAIKEFMAKR